MVVFILLFYLNPKFIRDYDIIMEHQITLYKYQHAKKYLKRDGSESCLPKLLNIIEEPFNPFLHDSNNK